LLGHCASLLNRDSIDGFRNYEPGDMLMFRRGARSFGIDKGAYARIESVDMNPLNLGASFLLKSLIAG
jgi:hypothetical protein